MIGPGKADGGFHEACGIVHDLDAGIARLCAAFGYALLWKGTASRGALDLMGVDSGVDGIEALVGDPTQDRGFIRLFAFPGLDNGVMRDGAQPWDFGGIFDINIRALGPIEALHRSAGRAGFRAFGPLTCWDFGPLAVKEVVETDSDGLAIALIERTAPPLEGFEHVRGDASYVFNSTQVVPSFAEARAFYTDALGWSAFQETSWVHEDGRNCMGLPLDAAKTKQLHVGIYHPAGLNEGSVEILQYEGEALDYSRAAPPDRGWASLRFPVTDLDGFLVRAARGGAATLAARPIEMQPYGTVEAAAAITPWGARIEVYRLST